MRVASALLAAMALCSLQPTVQQQQDFDMDELMRRVDTDGGVDLDELLRQASSSSPDGRDDGEAGSGAPEARARPSDAQAGGARARQGAYDASRAEASRERAGRAEPRTGGAYGGGADEVERARRRARDQAEPPPDVDLSDYETPARATMGGFGFGGAPDADPDEGDGSGDDDADEGDADEEDFAAGSTLSLRLDKASLSVLRRWTNFANGVLLMLLGPVTLAISAGSLAFDKMILSVYVTCARRCPLPPAPRAPPREPAPRRLTGAARGPPAARTRRLFGLLFSAQELRVEPVHSWLRTNFQFMTTHTGRAAFLAL